MPVREAAFSGRAPQLKNSISYNCPLAEILLCYTTLAMIPRHRACTRSENRQTRNVLQPESHSGQPWRLDRFCKGCMT